LISFNPPVVCPTSIVVFEYTQKVGLEDIRKFKDEVSRHVYAPSIEESLKGGIDSGVEEIPTSLSMGYVMRIYLI